MNILENKKKFVVTIVLTFIFYWLLLCSVDVYFVVVMKEAPGWYNYINLSILTLPFVVSFIAYKYSGGKHRGIFVIGVFLTGCIVGYIELMWVLIEFHTMIGGQI